MLNKVIAYINNSNIHIAKYVNLLLYVSISILVLFFAFYKLGISPLNNADEGIYAEVSLEMFQNNHFLTPTYFGDVWLEKPPLHLWLNMVSLKIFGITTFAVRFWSAVFLVGNMLMMFLLGRFIYGDKSGLLAIVLFLTSQLFFTEHIGRTGDFDMGLIFFSLVAIYSYLKIKTNILSNWYILCGLALALGFLIKSVHIIPIYIVIFLDWIITSRRWDLFKNIILAFLISFALESLWIIPTFLTYPQIFIKQFYQGQIINRIQSDFGNHIRPWWWYLSFLKWSIAPFLYTSFLSLLFSLKNFKKEGVLFLWSVITLTLFSLISSKMHWHIFPAIIPIYLILSHQLLQLPKSTYLKNITFFLTFILGIFSYIKTNTNYSFKEVNSPIILFSAIVAFIFFILTLLKSNIKKSKVLLVSIILTIPIIGVTINMKRVSAYHFSPKPSELDQVMQNYSNKTLFLYLFPLNNNNLEPSDSFYFYKNKITPKIITELEDLQTGQIFLTPRKNITTETTNNFLILNSNNTFIVAQKL